MSSSRKLKFLIKTLDIVGHVGVLHGQRYAQQSVNTEATSQNGKPKGKNSKNSNHSGHRGTDRHDSDMEEPVIALFAVACLFGSTSLYEPPNPESMFKSKHKVSLAPISYDSR
jgi:hypothetical protein